VKKRILALIGLSLAAVVAASAQPVAQSENKVAAGSAPAPAVVHTPTKIGVIQAQTALVNTRDGQRAISEMNARLDPTRKAIEKKAADIRELQDKLQRGGNAMAEAARAETQRNIDTKTKAYNRDMEDAQAEAQAEQQKLLDELGQKMSTVIDKYAQANGYSVILDVSNPNTPVLYAANTVDITKEIVDLYDKTYPVTGTPATSTSTKPASMAPKPAATPASTTPVTPKKQP
jgi:outer membrane protein